MRPRSLQLVGLYQIGSIVIQPEIWGRSRWGLEAVFLHIDNSENTAS
jgi:hypothetical protein